VALSALGLGGGVESCTKESWTVRPIRFRTVRIQAWAHPQVRGQTGASRKQTRWRRGSDLFVRLQHEVTCDRRVLPGHPTRKGEVFDGYLQSRVGVKVGDGQERRVASVLGSLFVGMGSIFITRVHSSMAAGTLPAR
jgi:hypothetical protein